MPRIVGFFYIILHISGFFFVASRALEEPLALAHGESSEVVASPF